MASYSSFEEARAAVDRLSDERFPVEILDIVGSGLHLVERVTGRLATTRAAAGPASGAWFGLFIGILVGLFTHGPTWIGRINGGLPIGAAGGGAFGFAGHAATQGRRDFSSERALTATRYDITARGHTAQARSLLQQAGFLPDQRADASLARGAAETSLWVLTTVRGSNRGRAGGNATARLPARPWHCTAGGALAARKNGGGHGLADRRRRGPAGGGVCRLP